jgi:hypothetical protein
MRPMSGWMEGSEFGSSEGDGGCAVWLAFDTQFAAEFHSGRFADGAIENLAFEIGPELDELFAEYEGFVCPSDSRESS